MNCSTLNDYRLFASADIASSVSTTATTIPALLLTPSTKGCIGSNSFNIQSSQSQNNASPLINQNLLSANPNTINNQNQNSESYFPNSNLVNINQSDHLKSNQLDKSINSAITTTTTTTHPRTTTTTVATPTSPNNQLQFPTIPPSVPGIPPTSSTSRSPSIRAKPSHIPRSFVAAAAATHVALSPAPPTGNLQQQPQTNTKLKLVGEPNNRRESGFELPRKSQPQSTANLKQSNTPNHLTNTILMSIKTEDSQKHSSTAYSESFEHAVDQSQSLVSNSSYGSKPGHPMNQQRLDSSENMTGFLGPMHGSQSTNPNLSPQPNGNSN